jgi:hypothetical protein
MRPFSAKPIQVSALTGKDQSFGGKSFGGKNDKILGRALMFLCVASSPA